MTPEELQAIKARVPRYIDRDAAKDVPRLCQALEKEREQRTQLFSSLVKNSELQQQIEPKLDTIEQGIASKDAEIAKLKNDCEELVLEKGRVLGQLGDERSRKEAKNAEIERLRKQLVDLEDMLAEEIREHPDYSGIVPGDAKRCITRLEARLDHAVALLGKAADAIQEADLNHVLRGGSGFGEQAGIPWQHWGPCIDAKRDIRAFLDEGEKPTASAEECELRGMRGLAELAGGDEEEK